ncbi:selenide, water dikinase SelD [Ponticoccus sp. (in: a-proteobacteria)]|uniref:selenide, water dikinase SelD n=1 Tax=Ponticoccus sp. (in: a-proteobacteria) TaxID=1925025 RepID=UPI003AB68334
MDKTQLPATRDLVLIGGGHTHALVLRKWGMAPLPGARLTLVNPAPTTPYSGMLPGYLAGHYRRDALEIDLVRLARFAGARLILGRAEGIDLAGGHVKVPGRPDVAFDVLSVDIGVTSDLPDLPGFADHAVAAKPLAPFARAWSRYLQGTGPASVAVIGGGIAGAEIALALTHALRARGRTPRVHLVERHTILSGLHAGQASGLRAALQAAGIEVHEQTEAARIDAEGVLTNRGRIEAGFVCAAAGARAQPWLARSGLSTTEGFLDIAADLRCSDPRVFAAGDCAHMVETPRPKAGVYAVRQAPVLFDNLRATLSGQTALRRYRPQGDYLKLISLGRKSAIGGRFGLTVSGPWVWRWKDRIDRRFMDRFHALPAMPAPDLPRHHSAGLVEALGDKPLCGGCGAKLGQSVLAQATGPGGLPGDDAAILTIGGETTVMSTDHLREMVRDPVTMARIAAHHALGDILAMGAQPVSATATVILPRLSPELASRTLAELMQAARAVLAEAGAEIVGGHSSQGSELTVGFTLLGRCARRPITLAGAQPGDRLILTKPLGSGVVMAAEMAGEAPGAAAAEALELMTQSQLRAATLLGAARAMTDVTGFGLLGHLRNICLNSGTGAWIRLDRVPLMPGALALAERGVHSSLLAENRLAFPDLPRSPAHDLLLDPQTAGGLLAAVPETAGLIEALRAAGYRAEEIGEVTAASGRIEVV